VTRIKPARNIAGKLERAKAASEPIAVAFDYEPREVIDTGQKGRPVTFFHRKTRETVRRPYVYGSDIPEVVLQGILGTSSVLLPTSLWPHLCRTTSWPLARLRADKAIETFHKRIELVLGPVAREDARSVYFGLRSRLTERKLAAWRETARPDPVQIRLTGVEALKASLSKGKGAVLWATSTAFQSIVGKRALWESGFRASQISQSTHGFSQSGFGIRHLNPRVVAIENRYLNERIVFSPDRSASAMRRALRSLKNGHPVIFTNNTSSGESFIEVPLPDGGYTTMSAGVPNLGARHDIPVHTITTIETKPFREYEVSISPDLREGLEKTDLAVHCSQIALRVRDQVLDAVRRAPDQYIAWGLFRSESRFGNRPS